jgi:hypothetical protein
LEAEQSLGHWLRDSCFSSNPQVTGLPPCHRG